MQMETEVNFIVHKTFLKFHTKTELQHSPKQLRVLETCFNVKRKLHGYIELIWNYLSLQKPCDAKVV